MARQEILDFITQERGRGTSDDRIREHALKKGWDAGDVNGAFAALALAENPLTAREMRYVPRKKKNYIPQMVGIVVLLLFAMGVYAFLPTIRGSLSTAIATITGKSITFSDAPFVPFAPVPTTISKPTPSVLDKVAGLLTLHSSPPASTPSGAVTTGSTASNPVVVAPATPQQPASKPTVPAGSPLSNEPTVQIHANYSSVQPGDAVTISWSSTNATSCRASAGFSTGNATSGSATVHPVLSTSYAVTCIGANGTARESVFVTVSANTPPVPSTDPGVPTPTPTPTPTTTPPVPTGAAGTTITHTSGGIAFTWEFNCGGAPCVYGTFVNGDYWVVPITNTGTRVAAVTVTNISPTGLANGAEVNPQSTSRQGILPMYASYDASLNVMAKLPYQALPGQSIYKASTRTTGCGTAAITAGCVTSDDVLTVLNDVPPNNGTTVFRPPFHGNWKPLYTTDKVRLGRLPSLAGMPTLDAAAIARRWSVPQYDTTHGPGFSGEFMRATSPDAAIDDYAAGQAAAYLADLFALYGTATQAQKAPAAYAMIQKGIDVYGIFKLGIPFQSGAGQHLGKKPALTFFAAMYDDPALLTEVRGIATNSYYEKNNFFQEDSQIQTGQGGVPIWGTPDTETLYWSRIYPGIDNKGTESDPYGYVDGPPGSAFPTSSTGRSYLGVSGGPLIGFAFAQDLMPWLRYADNDTEILKWSDRAYAGYGTPGFPGGFWASPDPCAPKDAREPLTCAPQKTPTGCLYYKVTWGPDPANPGQCIKHNGDPMKDGRMSALNGKKLSFVYMPPTVPAQWANMRACSDPTSSTYRTGACAGMGPEVGSGVAVANESESGKLAAVEAAPFNFLAWVSNLLTTFWHTIVRRFHG